MNIYSALGQQTVIPSSSTGNATDKTAAEAAKAKAEKDKVDFLKLLLTQLSNQNPLDPMNTDEWTAQLTRYSILEQGIETNENLSVTNSLLQTNATAASFSYIGKEVEVSTNINVIQNGDATWSYVIEGSASDVKLTVTDSTGNRIDEIDGSIASGVHSLTINAADYGLTEGQKLYLSVNATDSDKNKLNSETSSTMTVEGVWTDNNQSYLTAGQLSFRPTDILKLVETQTATNQPSTP